MSEKDKFQILIVEDVHSTAVSIREALIRDGFSEKDITECYKLEDAKKILKRTVDKPSEKFDVITLDLYVEIDPRHAAIVALQKGQELGLPSEQIAQVTDLYLRAASVMGDKKALQVMFVGETPGAEMPIEEVLEIFVRVNSGGLVLQKSDLLMSLLDLKWNDIQPELQTIVRDINEGHPYNLTRDDVLKSLKT